MTAANNFVSDLYHLAERKGLDTGKLLQHAGIDPSVIDSPDIRVDSQKLAVIVSSLWDELQDESMGLSQDPIPRGAFLMMGKLAVHEPTLRDALQMATRFYSMVTNAYRIIFEVEGDTATLQFRMASKAADEQHLFAEITLMMWHRFSSWLIAENVILSQVFFDYPAPNHVGEYSYLYPGNHNFDSDHLGFSFPCSFLESRVSQTPETLSAFFKRGPIELFMQPTTDFSLTREVQLLLKKYICEGFPTIDDAASQLHMTPRTLIRKLKQEGTSYQELKDRVRRDAAVWLLTSQSMPLSEIALAVGFSDAAVFTRAFKSWTGMTPRVYRVNAAAG